MERLVFAAIDPLPTPLPTPLRCDVGSLTPAFVADNVTQGSIATELPNERKRDLPSSEE